MRSKFQREMRIRTVVAESCLLFSVTFRVCVLEGWISGFPSIFRRALGKKPRGVPKIKLTEIVRKEWRAPNCESAPCHIFGLVDGTTFNLELEGRGAFSGQCIFLQSANFVLLICSILCKTSWKQNWYADKIFSGSVANFSRPNSDIMDCHQAFYFQLREFGKKGKYRGSFQMLPSRLARLSKLGISLLALIVSLISVSWSVSPIISHPRCHRLFCSNA